MSSLLAVPLILCGISAMHLLADLPLRWMRISPFWPGRWPLQTALGYAICMAYLMVRLAIVEFTGWSIAPWELPTFVLVALAVTVWLRRRELLDFRRFVRDEVASPLNIAYFLGLGLLVTYYALPILSALAPASSDPDIHAYLLRQVHGLGRIPPFYPHSDVPISYPMGFVLLNLPLLYLTGLTPVQVVGFQPYLQSSLFFLSAAALAVAPGISRRQAILFGLVVGVLGTIAYNPIFSESRAYLEGTARLSHTFYFFLPVLLGMAPSPDPSQSPSEGACRRRSAFGWAGFLGFLVVFALLVSPAHLAPSLLLLLWALRSRLCARLLIGAAGAAMVLGTVCFVFDPFYRGLVLSALGPGMAAAPEAGSSLRPSVVGFLGSYGETLLGVIKDAVQRKTFFFQLALAALVLAWAVPKNAREGLRGKGRHLLVTLLAFTATSVLLVTAIGAVLPQTTINNVLLYVYTRGIVTDTILFFSIAVVVAVATGVLVLWRTTSTGRRVLGVCAILWLTVLVFRGHRDYARFLGATACGKITADDLRLVRWAEGKIPAGERVLGPVNLLKGGLESWVLAAGGFRAFALYGNVPTAFFYGLDGKEFTVQNYEAHVLRFDHSWLSSRGIRWLYTSADFPEKDRIGHYELAQSFGESRLWRLKEESKP